MDKLRSMQTFSLVAELGSFTKAALALNLPNATVSTQVAQLEAHLQTRLLLRTTRTLALTDDGTAYLERAKRLLSDIDELEGHLKGAQQRAKGRLRIDVPAAAGRHVIAPALPDFLAKYPDMTIEIGSTDRPVDLIGEGVDCVIRGGTIHDEMLVAKKLGEFEVLTLAAPAYIKKYGKPKSPSDLEKHIAVNFFSAKTGRIFPFDFAHPNGTNSSLSVSHKAAANDADTHVQLTVEGLGIAQIPNTHYVKSLIKAGKLIEVLKPWSAGSLPIYVMYPRNRHLSKRVRVFVDWVVELYQHH